MHPRAKSTVRKRIFASAESRVLQQQQSERESESRGKARGGGPNIENFPRLGFLTAKKKDTHDSRTTFGQLYIYLCDSVCVCVYIYESVCQAWEDIELEERVRRREYQAAIRQTLVAEYLYVYTVEYRLRCLMLYMSWLFGGISV